MQQGKNGSTSSESDGHSARFSSAFLPASRFPPNSIFVGAPTTPYLSTCRRLGKVVGLCRRCSPRFPRHTPIDREASQYATLFRVARGSRLGRTRLFRHSPSDRRSPRCVSHAARSSRESRAWSSQCRRQLGGTGTCSSGNQTLFIMNVGWVARQRDLFSGLSTGSTVAGG